MIKIIFIMLFIIQTQYTFSQDENDNSKKENSDKVSIESLIEDDKNSKDKEEEKPAADENKEVNIGSNLAQIVKLISDYNSFKEIQTSTISQIDEKRLELLDKSNKLLVEVEKEIKKEEENISNNDSTILLLYKEEYKQVTKDLRKLDDIRTGKISLIGNAAILNSNSAEGSAVSGTGSIGISYSLGNNTFIGKAFLVLLSSPDTIISSYNSSGLLTNSQDFGRSIVNPFSGSKSVQSGYLEFRKYLSNFPYKGLTILGFQGHIGYANRLWLDSGITTTDTVNQLITANILAGSVGVFWNPIGLTKSKIKNDLSLYIDLGITGRFLYGDIRYENSIKEQLLGTNQVDYWGIDLGFELRYKGFSGYINFPALFSSGGAVKGLTAGQFVGGFSISTSILDFNVESDY